MSEKKQERNRSKTGLDLDLPRVLVLVNDYIRLLGKLKITVVLIVFQMLLPLEPNLTLELKPKYNLWNQF